MSRNALPHIRLGVIGCGTAATMLHRPALRRCTRVTVAGLFDLHAEAARRCAIPFPGVRLYDWAEELVSDPAIDAVAILTPPASHGSLVETALRAGKHLLVEMPLTLSAPEAWRLAEMGRESGLVCAVSAPLRQHRLVQRAREAMATRRIGRIAAVHSICNSSRFRRIPQSSWRNHGHLGGNLLHELGVHHLDLWRSLLGEELHALHAETLEVGEASTRVQLVTRSYSGVLVHTTLVAADLDFQEFEIVGERGSIRFCLEDPFSYREMQSAGARGGRESWVGVWNRTLGDAAEGVVSRWAGGDLAASYRAQWESFAEAVMLGGRAPATFADGYVAVELVERAYGASLRQIDLQPRAAQGMAEAGPAPSAAGTFAPGAGQRAPVLSVILATQNRFATLKPVLAHLRSQTIASDLELLLVVPSHVVFDVDAQWMEGFESWQLVRVPARTSAAACQAAGVRHARAALVSLVADHCFPQPRWAEMLVAAHQRGHIAVSPVIANANPETAVSWADFLMRAGDTLHGRKSGEPSGQPGLNSSYRRSHLLDLGEDLEVVLATDQLAGGWLRGLDTTAYVEAQALSARVNYALFDSWIAASFFRGRVSAGLRTNHWNAARRLAYCLGTIVGPYVRVIGAVTAMEEADFEVPAILRSLPYLWLGFTVECMGEFVGYATGVGRADAALAHYEGNRSLHVTPSERETLFERFQRA